MFQQLISFYTLRTHSTVLTHLQPRNCLLWCSTVSWSMTSITLEDVECRWSHHSQGALFVTFFSLLQIRVFHVWTKQLLYLDILPVKSSIFQYVMNHRADVFPPLNYRCQQAFWWYRSFSLIMLAKPALLIVFAIFLAIDLFSWHVEQNTFQFTSN